MMIADLNCGSKLQYVSGITGMCRPSQGITIKRGAKAADTSSETNFTVVHRQKVQVILIR
jgi:hypothetical protein